MHVHRTQHPNRFTVLPNGLLQARGLSYTARGLLADLLSRPDGWREDGRHMADSSTQGRGAVNRALRELTLAGYYVVHRVRQADGTIRSETHVFDTPQRPKLPCAPEPPEPAQPPDARKPGPGDPKPGPPVVPLQRRKTKEPTLPTSQVSQPAQPDGELRAAVALLFRVLRPEPRLHIGEREAYRLAPLVRQWVERGATHLDLTTALLPGLPATVHFPGGVLHDRLTRKLPPPPDPGDQPLAYTECPTCRGPAPRYGLCRPCAGLEPPPPRRDPNAIARGVAIAREALHGRTVSQRRHSP
ncbi:hypothetical protein [Kitasatospora viridis]|uniref:Helix-turn-helix protein n=1 Tax=Kitasatospora viridis TaxID=281105 RepID=A0A561UH41_9ACTN|nr:hypothetical protein [Kitasatospora viridis]TWF98677.1 hypothetical protein FHX73_112498 [Kitasatospora viridis]